MKTNIVLGGVFIAFTILVVVVGYFVLPDTLVMQMTISGDAGTTVAKPLGLVILAALGIIGGVFTIGNRDKDKQYRSYMILLVLTIVFVMTYVFNL